MANENELKKEEEKMLDEKELQLKQYHEKLKQENDKFKKEKEEFEAYKKIEKEKLEDELNEKRTLLALELEKLKTEEISKLRDGFADNIQKEYDKIRSKIDKLTQTELKLVEWQQELDNNKKIFQKDRELFDSQKEKLLNEYKSELEKDKEIFKNELEKDRVKKLEEINNTLDDLYRDKESKIKAQEDKLIEQEGVLKNKIAEVEAKEKALELEAEFIYNQEKEKVQEEVKFYQDKITSSETLNQGLKEEILDLREELNQYEKFEDRDLPHEIEEKRKEIDRLNNLLNETTNNKNKSMQDFDSFKIENKKKIDELYAENSSLIELNKETEKLRSEKAILEEKEMSYKNHIEFLKGENKDLNERLKSIYSDGTEIEERIKDIKEKPYKKIQLDTQISILDEIKYLDAIQDNMKKYGVEYPRRLLNAFHTALKCSDFSPLAVLSGVSGTGKSELPKLYSHFGGFNFLAEAVQPTWDSPASMIGYYNTIDRKFDSTNILKFLIQTSMSKNESPYGLKESMNMILLDEMNLAHIELYFAEFLSKFEQRRGSKEGDVNIDIQLGTALIHPLPLDRNIIWIGTMNEDETTKTLSDKVLDRAFLINFPRPTELKSRVKLQTLEDIKPFEYLHRDTWNKWIKKESLFAGEKYEIIHKYREISNKINEYLAPTGRAIGHRVWQSMEYYINNHPEVIQNIGNDEELNKKTKLAFEEQLVQKIMPKLRGIEVHGEEKKTLDNIKEILNQNEFAVTEDFELAMDNPYGQFIWNSANYLKED
ncbi:translation initiation factor IF-2 [Aliarcobacter cryaerophilus]|uniref:translation initiation factor IF-2 n=1 Tax=Aliarcobacter cryaerophilus TaxID=28198 RepID=UPI0021B643D9|nr:translation initiation factor IF-2 [Aliarcobacter cryaerophilus]MCT7518908.1 translation initiation factor IF-2 [Aliarcobacter cryaerophilus]